MERFSASYQYFQNHPAKNHRRRVDHPPAKSFAILKMLTKSAPSAKLTTTKFFSLSVLASIPAHAGIPLISAWAAVKLFPVRKPESVLA